MKKDTMFEHKEVTIIYEENMGDVNDYQKLFKQFIKPKNQLFQKV